MQYNTIRFLLGAGVGVGAVDASTDKSGLQGGDGTGGPAGNQNDAAKQPDEQQKANGFKPPESQEELDRIVQSRLARDRGQIQAQYGDLDDLKAKAEELARIKDGEKTELQKANERADAAEKELTTLRTEQMKRDAAEAVGLPIAQAHRLSGSTPDELEADAREFLSGWQAASTPKPNKNQGQANSGKHASVAAGRDLFAKSRGKSSA